MRETGRLVYLHAWSWPTAHGPGVVGVGAAFWLGNHFCLKTSISGDSLRKVPALV
jgi:hypothetical protein